MQTKPLSSGFLCAMRFALLQLDMLLSRMDRAPNWVTRKRTHINVLYADITMLPNSGGTYSMQLKALPRSASRYNVGYKIAN